MEPLAEDSKSGKGDDAGSSDATDDLYEQAKEMIQSTQYASTSYLQRVANWV